MLSRRSILNVGALSLGAPMLNRGLFSLFAKSEKKYSARTVDLVHRSTVIDMLGLLTLDYRKLSSWESNPGQFRQIDFLRLKESGITVFHPAVGFIAGDIYTESKSDERCHRQARDGRENPPPRQAFGLVGGRSYYAEGCVSLGVAQSGSCSRDYSKVAGPFGRNEEGDRSRLTTVERREVGGGRLESRTRRDEAYPDCPCHGPMPSEVLDGDLDRDALSNAR